MPTAPPPPDEPHLPSAPPISDNDLRSTTPARRGPLLAGLGVGLALFLAVLLLTVVAGRDQQDYWALGLLGYLAGLTVLMLVVGLGLTISPRTRGFGVGLLISVAAGLFIDGGTCIVLLQSA